MTTTVQPRLIVTDVDAAVAFYGEVFGARETFRATVPPGDPEGAVVHCVLAIGPNALTLAEANDDYRLYAPGKLGGSPVLLTATVADAYAVGTAIESRGGRVVVPIEDRDYGKREGRLEDPFGHLWVVSQTLS